MEGILVEHAKQNVWCEPGQDYQEVIKLARLTTSNGALKKVRVMWSYVDLPPQPESGRVFYQLYQIGQYSPYLLDLNLNKGIWYRLDELMYDQSMTINLFLGAGTIVPSNHAYIQLGHNRNLMVCVGLPTIFNLGAFEKTNVLSDVTETISRRLSNQTLYIRFYANALFDDPAWRSEINPDIGDTDARYPIQTYTKKITSVLDINIVKNKINDFRAINSTTGNVVITVDGFVVNDLTLNDVAYIGKEINVVYDDSYYLSPFDFPIRELAVFNSELDQFVSKFILLTDREYDVVDYHDDIDVFILPKPEVVTGYVNSLGSYVPIIKPSDFRNLTHSAYSISTDLIENVIDGNANLKTLGIDNLIIRLMVRKGGKANGVLNQYTRIEALYELPRDVMLQTLTGVNSVMPEWSAASLEKSDYNRLLSADAFDITPELVESSYGYSQVARLFINPIHEVTTEVIGAVTQRVINVSDPFTIIDEQIDSANRAVFLYQNGIMADWFNDTFSSNIISIPPNKAPGTISHAEVFMGEVSEDYDGVLYDQDIKRSDLGHYGFCVYVSTMQGGIPLEDWVDVTDTAYYTYYENGFNDDGIAEIKWNWTYLNEANLFPAVRINKYIHLYRPDLISQVNNEDHRSVDGLLYVALNTRVTWFGVTATRVQSIPPACLDVFVNGVNLVEGIDYYVEWPYICIVYTYDTTLEDTEVVIRTYGCGDPTLERSFPPREVGFVKQGLLSVNGIYNPENDRPTRIVSEGRIYARDEVSFVERDGGALIADGRPYSISDYILPVESFTTQSTIPYIKRSIDMDKRVRDFVNVYLDEPAIVQPTISGFKWEIYSPVCALLLHMFENGYLVEETKVQFNNLDVDEWINPVRYLFAFDPCIRGFDENYLSISTHGSNRIADIYPGQYRLLEYIIYNYLSGKVDPTPTVTIKPYP